MGDWNSEQYLKFKKERTQPSFDLTEKIEAVNPKRIIDIGCGPGNSTAVLKKQFPDAYILGVDFSPNMIEKAKTDYPDMDFMLFDAEKDFDPAVIFLAEHCQFVKIGIHVEKKGIFGHIRRFWEIKIVMFRKTHGVKPSADCSVCHFLHGDGAVAGKIRV